MNTETGLRGDEERKATILIVDDIPENLAVLGDLLQPAYRVQVATNGMRALALAAAEPRPDLILLDVMMPDMDGYQVLQHLLADPVMRTIPVIFVTALDMTQDEERGLRMGAVDYISKPLRPAIVLARVSAHIELKRARDRLEDHNASLEAEVARRMAENQLIQDVSILALARLAETRDSETGNHLQRTKGYVRELAERLKSHPRFSATLAPHVRDLMVKSAPLHDIGKVGIPDHILLKPGKLTPEEWEIMKTHAALGSEAIAQAERDAAEPVEFLRIAKEIARHHHERWDGTGYPDGLAGDAIPVSARLMAIADVFDALVNARSYKTPMSFDQARTIMTAERGKHFDPDVTDAFMAAFEEFKAIAQRYRDSPSGAGSPPTAAE